MRFPLAGLASGVADWSGDGKILIACLGDSNTDEYYNPVCAPTWVTKMNLLHPEWGTVNLGHSSAPIVPIPGDPNSILAQFDLLMSLPVRPDILVLAGGSNDLMRWDSVSTPENMSQTLQEIDARAAAGGIHDRWYCTVPPLDPSLPNTGPINTVIQQVNVVLRAAPLHWIDLYTGFAQHKFFQDIVHFNQQGQTKRAGVITNRIVR